MKNKIKFNNYYCDNIIIKNEKEYYLEKVWRLKKTDYTKDSKGNTFPYPKENKLHWGDKNDVIERLRNIERYFKEKKLNEQYENNGDCLLCNNKNILTTKYISSKIIWNDSLLHYIESHNIEPSLQFKEFIFSTKISNLIKNLSKISNTLNNNMILEHIISDNKEYVKITRNQLMILDSLLIHGGKKKYINDNTFLYSEHAGMLDFHKNNLHKIIVSAKTNRIDDDDNEIFFPHNITDFYHYEYIFHTHPPTPTPGSRAENNILYEFPSISDIFHFIDIHNAGNGIGSLVFAPEGMYNIRKFNNDNNNIIIDDNVFQKKYDRIYKKVQLDAISQYGTKFDTNKFYSVISQDTTHINKINNLINQFNIHIDFYPRKKDMNNDWIVDTLFLVFRAKNK